MKRVLKVTNLILIHQLYKQRLEETKDLGASNIENPSLKLQPVKNYAFKT